jgi:hypothetical protein
MPLSRGGSISARPPSAAAWTNSRFPCEVLHHNLLLRFDAVLSITR